jgi:hypothetical protein
MQEINNCNFFLEKDDRNFHVWNHRLTIFSMIREYFPDNFKEFLSKELNFTLLMVKKNLSNFSAWHYRSKLIPIYFKLERKSWTSQEALDFFKLDLELITNAVYTDPKDQSPWTYHLWIINNLTPIYVENYEIKNQEKEIKIKFSEVFKWKEIIKLTSENENQLDKVLITPENNNEFSNTIIINLQNLHDENVTLKLFGNSENISEISNLCYSKNNLSLPEILINYSKTEFQLSIKILNTSFEEHQLKFLESQIKVIDDLIKNSESGFLEYAHFRKAQIYNNLYHLTSIEKNNESLEYKHLLNSEYEILKTNSKRMKTMYEEFSLRLNSEI